LGKSGEIGKKTLDKGLMRDASVSYGILILWSKKEGVLLL